MSPSGARRAKPIARRAPRQVPAACNVSKPRRCAHNAGKKQPYRSSLHKDVRYIAANVSSSGDRSGHRVSRRRKKRVFFRDGLNSAERSSRQFELRLASLIGGRGGERVRKKGISIFKGSSSRENAGQSLLIFWMRVLLIVCGVFVWDFLLVTRLRELRWRERFRGERPGTLRFLVACRW